MNNNNDGLISLLENQKVVNGKYTDIRRISSDAGGGYTSFVFKAKDIADNQMVALKFFKPNIRESYRVESFEREVTLLTKFKDKANILSIKDDMQTLTIRANVNGFILPIDFRFYCTELADSDLQSYIMSVSSNAKQSIFYFKEVCKALQRIHTYNICHRDLKPKNFLLFGKDTLKLCDFGTARSFDKNAHPILRSYSFPVGDLTCTSPELLAGLYFVKNLSFCSDFYALGAMLFELFTKSKLNLYLFNNIQNIKNFSRTFFQTLESDRKTIYDGAISSITKSNPLPDIHIFGTQIPNCIRDYLNKLYKSLACLDYRGRLTEFGSIFRQIDIIRIILENEKKYKKWMALKRRKKETINVNSDI